jgi:uncharacterized membrane protein
MDQFKKELDDIVNKTKVDAEKIIEKTTEFGKNLDASRSVSRTAIYQIVLLSAGIVGFSVSLFSIPTLQSGLDLYNLKLSWYFFTATIILGFFVLLFEGRIEFAIVWKNFQPSQLPNPGEYSYSLREKLVALFIVLTSVFNPSNLVFNRVYETEDEKKYKERINGLVVHRLAIMKNELVYIENIVFVTFVCGITLLVLSF